MFGLFRKRETLDGVVEIAGLPPFKGYSITLSLVRVTNGESPFPFAGDPPPEARLDEADVATAEHFDHEDVSGAIRAAFRLQWPRGWYYIQLNVVLYREQGGRMFAQVERFFFRKRPVQIPQIEGQQVTLPVSWPSTEIKDMEQFGAISPKGK